MNDDLPRLARLDGGTQVHYRGKNLYSPVSPAAAADRRADLIEVKPQTLLLVPSPLLCYGIESLLKKLPEDSFVLCVEVDESLMAVTTANIPDYLVDHPRVQFIRTDSPEKIAAFVDQRIGIGRFRRLTLAPLNAGYSLNGPAYRKLADALDREIQVFWQNRLTGAFFGRLWVRNLISNLGELAAGGETVPPPATTGPVVVAGAGESLESVLPWLRDCRKQIYLFAVDTALPPLFEAGITPDLVLVVEAQWANIQDFVPLGRNAALHLWSDLSGSPTPLRLAVCAKTSVFLSRFSPCRIIQEVEERQLVDAVVPPLGSVGVSAAYLARRITSGDVLLAGLDFSYQPGKPHARGTASHLAYLHSTQRLSPDPLYESSTRRRKLRPSVIRRTGFVTDSVLLSYARDLNAIIRDDPRVFLLGDCGMDLGVPRVKSQEELVKLLTGADAGLKIGNMPEAPANRQQAAREFLEEQNRRLEAVRELITNYLNVHESADRAAMWTELRRSLEQSDYLYFDFPDAAVGPTDSPAFLRRVLSNVSGYLRRFTQILRADQR
ncbi:MAG TPA: 6-hydroxymethylpterin diphosphokinase MptE-like protein [Spirochaetia bacterium]|nr:6-hydroxymethylpterin diphosphokinase MptE-like protein [Spirochaetia bacterium]